VFNNILSLTLTFVFSSSFSSGCHVEEEKFLVFKSCLWELFATCPKCSKPCLAEEKYRKGTKVMITQDCPDCEYKRDWSSQPSYLGDIPAGNLQLSGAILFTGASPSKTLRVLKAMNVVTSCISTFNNHMSRFLVPTILTTWKEEQEQLFSILREMDGGLVIGGDGRNDSPGHSAKYGSYTVLEERINKIIDQQCVQVFINFCSHLTWYSVLPLPLKLASTIFKIICILVC
jgi:solute carrier family 8 (sodium/calcium exchanger)